MHLLSFEEALRALRCLLVTVALGLHFVAQSFESLHVSSRGSFWEHGQRWDGQWGCLHVCR